MIHISYLGYRKKEEIFYGRGSYYKDFLFRRSIFRMQRGNFHVYAFSYLFRRIVPGIMAVLLYSVLVFMEGNGNMKIFTYFSAEVSTGYKLIVELLPILVMSVILFFIGIVANKRFVKKW